MSARVVPDREEDDEDKLMVPLERDGTWLIPAFQIPGGSNKRDKFRFGSQDEPLPQRRLRQKTSLQSSPDAGEEEAAAWMHGTRTSSRLSLR